MNIPSSNLIVEISVMDGCYLVVWGISNPPGRASMPECRRVLKPNEMEKFFASVGEELVKAVPQ